MSTDGIGESLWQACVDQLAQELSEQQFNTWIKPLTAQVADDLSRMTVFVANRFKLDWIRAQYAGKIAAMAEKMYGQPVAVELALAPREAPVRSAPWPSWPKPMCRATWPARARNPPPPASRTA
jgi:chromosomal replication initiator protein